MPTDPVYCQNSPNAKHKFDSIGRCVNCDYRSNKVKERTPDEAIKSTDDLIDLIYHISGRTGNMPDTNEMAILQNQLVIMRALKKLVEKNG